MEKKLAILGIFILAIVAYFAGIFEGPMAQTTITRGKFGKEDAALWDGTAGDTKFTQARGVSGYTVKLNKFDWVGVDVFQEYGGGVNSRDTEILSAVSSIGCTQKSSLWLAPRNWGMSGTSVSFPSNLEIVVSSGASFYSSNVSGTTINFHGPFDAGLFACFNSAQNATGVTVVFHAGSVKEVHPQWWGATGNWNGTIGTDDTVAIQSAIDSYPVVNGGGGSFLVTSEIKAKSWSPVIGTTLRRITLHGKHTGKSVLSLVGTSFCNLDESVTLEGNATTIPKTILLMGRTSAGSAGWHKLNPIVTGSASEAGIYSVASEGNVWTGLFMSVASKYGFYTAQGDDLTIGELTGSSNLTLYLSSSHLQITSTDANSAVIYINAGFATGFHSYRDSYLAAGSGNYVVIKTGSDLMDTINPIIFENIGGEASAGCTPTTGILFSSALPGHGLRNAEFRKISLAGVTYAFNTTVPGGLLYSMILNNCLIDSAVTKPSVFGTLSDSTIKMLGVGDITTERAFRNTINKGTGIFSVGTTTYQIGNIIHDQNSSIPDVELGKYSDLTAKIIQHGDQRIAWTGTTPIYVAGAGNFNSWRQGDVINNTSAASGQPSGWRCITSGTFSAAATTGGISAGTILLTVAAATNFSQGDYVAIVGVTGVFKIRAINGLVFTLDASADATVAGAAVTTPDPTFAAMANLP